MDHRYSYLPLTKSFAKKSLVCFLLLIFFSLSAIAQRTLLVEKIGKSAKYYYHVGDKIKLQTLGKKTIYKGVLSEIRDS